MIEKINVEAILCKHCGCSSTYMENLLATDVKAAIREIVEAVIDKCAEDAKTCSVEEYFNHEFHYTLTINKDSILKIKGEIEYE